MRLLRGHDESVHKRKTSKVILIFCPFRQLARLTILRESELLARGQTKKTQADMTDDILAPRLRLIAATAALLRAERDAPATLAALLNARADETWVSLPNFVLEIMIARAEQRDENGNLWPTFYIVERARNLLIGGINFKGLPHDGEIEIGYELARAQWNRGYATAAVAALCEQAFARGLERVCAGVDENNLASARVLRKNGFERDGTDRDGRLRFVKIKF